MIIANLVMILILVGSLFFSVLTDYYMGKYFTTIYYMTLCFFGVGVSTRVTQLTQTSGSKKRIMKIVFYIIGVLALGEGSGEASSQQLEEFNRVTMSIDLAMELVGTTEKLE